MVPFLYLAIKSLYWSKGATLSKFMWCSEESIKPDIVMKEFWRVNEKCRGTL